MTPFSCTRAPANPWASSTRAASRCSWSSSVFVVAPPSLSSSVSKRRTRGAALPIFYPSKQPCVCVPSPPAVLLCVPPPLAHPSRAFSAHAHTSNGAPRGRKGRAAHALRRAPRAPSQPRRPCGFCSPFTPCASFLLPGLPRSLPPLSLSLSLASQLFPSQAVPRRSFLKSKAMGKQTFPPLLQRLAT